MEEDKAHDLYLLFKKTDAAAKQKQGLGFGGGFGSVNDGSYNSSAPVKAFGSTLQQPSGEPETAAPASWLAKKLAERKQAQSAQASFQAGYQQALAAAQASQVVQAAAAQSRQSPPVQRRSSPDYKAFQGRRDSRSPPRLKRASPDYSARAMPVDGGDRHRRGSPDYSAKHAAARSRSAEGRRGRSSDRDRRDEQSGRGADRGGSFRREREYKDSHPDRSRRRDDDEPASRADRSSSGRQHRSDSRERQRYGRSYEPNQHWNGHEAAQDRQQHRSGSGREGREGRHDDRSYSEGDRSRQQHRSSKRSSEEHEGRNVRQRRSSSRERRQPGAECRRRQGDKRDRQHDDGLTPAERLRVQRHAALEKADRAEAERGPRELDERGWTRQVFSSYAPLLEEEGVAPVDRPALAEPTRGLDETDGLPARRDVLAERRQQRADNLHEDAIFGVSRPAVQPHDVAVSGAGLGAGAARPGLGLGLSYSSGSSSAEDSPGGFEQQQGSKQEQVHQRQQLLLDDKEGDDEDLPQVVSLPSSPQPVPPEQQLRQQQAEQDLAAVVVGQQRLDWRQRAAMARQRRA